MVRMVFFPPIKSYLGILNACAKTIEPLFPDGLQAPILELPFAPGEEWALTGGLHNDWNTGTPLGALDFAPITGESHCAVSRVPGRLLLPRASLHFQKMVLFNWTW